MAKKVVNFVKEDAEIILDIIFLINQIGLKNYEKNWRKIHKEMGISASQKVKLKNVDYHYLEKTQPKDKRRKPISKLNYADIVYKDYKYYVSYNWNRHTEERYYKIQSYYHYNEKEQIERSDV